jgi:hypothetical protein
MALADVEDARTAQASEGGDLVVGVAGLAQPNDLQAALMPCFAAQRSHVGCLHESDMRATQQTSSAKGPDQ